MQTFGDSYSGQQDSAHGVLAMLEVILSDFANLETETATSEAESQKMHERYGTNVWCFHFPVHFGVIYVLF